MEPQRDSGKPRTVFLGLVAMMALVVVGMVVAFRPADAVVTSQENETPSSEITGQDLETVLGLDAVERGQVSLGLVEMSGAPESMGDDVDLTLIIETDVVVGTGESYLLMRSTTWAAPSDEMSTSLRPTSCEEVGELAQDAETMVVTYDAWSHPDPPAVTRPVGCGSGYRLTEIRKHLFWGSHPELDVNEVFQVRPQAEFVVTLNPDGTIRVESVDGNWATFEVPEDLEAWRREHPAVLS